MTTRRLLKDQMAVVVASDSGTKDCAMWHVHNVTASFNNHLCIGLKKTHITRISNSISYLSSFTITAIAGNATQSTVITLPMGAVIGDTYFIMFYKCFMMFTSIL